MRILIIGLRGDFASKFKKEYKGKIKLCFLTDQARYGKKVGGSFDHIIACVKFINHTVEYQYKSHESFIRIQGGYTSIKKTLDDLLIAGEASCTHSSKTL